ncbi:t-SNARE VTI1 [Yarrowia sp. C11]|nr:t-SNARE VTI1 [Yarrowia sp. E02]KAG5371561.1 t-SNARE VTI1 [Yarrowia sp. C11]
MEASELYKSYETDFLLAQSEIEQKLESISTLERDARTSAVKAVERTIGEAYEILDQLSVEIQNIPSSSRAPLSANLRQYRQSIQSAKKQLANVEQAGARNELFGDRSAGGDGDIALDQRQQLLSGQESLDRSSQRIRDSQRLANETESIGANILTDLRGQREQIQNSRNTLLEADGYVDKSIRTLRSMTRRMAMNKVLTYLIIAVLVILILLVLASKFW